MPNRRLSLTAVLSTFVLTGGCAAGYHESIPDPELSNTQLAELVVFPEYVGNVYTKCDHGNRLYVHLDTGSLDVVENAEDCEATK